MELSPSLEADSCLVPKKFPNFLWSPKVYKCSQEPSTGPFPQPDESSPYHPMLHRDIGFSDFVHRPEIS
jgi:hypothetical protein